MTTPDQFLPPRLPHPPQKVVSLVPSQTESLFELGLGHAVAGITDYCIHPALPLAGLPRLGGPKNPRLADILALQPDLVLANWEENTPRTVNALRQAGIPVWVSFPKSVRASIQVLVELAGLFRSPIAMQRVKTLELAYEWAQAAAADGRPVRCFCPVWYDQTSQSAPWWMTFNQDTYCHDLLAVCGAENIFAGRRRRYPLAADLGLEAAQEPGERDTRYPRVSLEEVIAARPELVLLPDEPFGFDASHREEMLNLLSATPAGQTGRVLLVDGSLITWHGIRLARALRELPGLVQAPDLVS